MNNFKQKYFDNFLTTLDPSDKPISGNQIFRWYINYCNNKLHIHDKKSIYDNRQQFIQKMRNSIGELEIFNSKTMRSSGWKIKLR